MKGTNLKDEKVFYRTSESIFKNKYIAEKDSMYYLNRNKKRTKKFKFSEEKKMIKYISREDFYNSQNETGGNSKNLAEKDKSKSQIISNSKDVELCVIPKQIKNLEKYKNENFMKVKREKEINFLTYNNTYSSFYTSTSPSKYNFIQAHQGPLLKPCKKSKLPEIQNGRVNSPKERQVLHEREMILDKPEIVMRKLIRKYIVYINELLGDNYTDNCKSLENNQEDEIIGTDETYISFKDEIDLYKEYLRELKKEDFLKEKADWILKSNLVNRKTEDEEKITKSDFKVNVNKYMDKTLHNVYRRVAYLNEKNVQITEDLVVNLIKSESDEISRNLDKAMESLCNIKGFSAKVQDKGGVFILPFLSMPTTPQARDIVYEKMSEMYLMHNSTAKSEFYRTSHLNSNSSTFYSTNSMMRGTGGSDRYLKTHYPLRTVLSPINERDLDDSFRNSSHKNSQKKKKRELTLSAARRLMDKARGHEDLNDKSNNYSHSLHLESTEGDTAGDSNHTSPNIGYIHTNHTNPKKKSRPKNNHGNRNYIDIKDYNSNNESQHDTFNIDKLDNYSTIKSQESYKENEQNKITLQSTYSDVNNKIVKSKLSKSTDRKENLNVEDSSKTKTENNEGYLIKINQTSNNTQSKEPYSETNSNSDKLLINNYNNQSINNSNSKIENKDNSSKDLSNSVQVVIIDKESNQHSKGNSQDNIPQIFINKENSDGRNLNNLGNNNLTQNNSNQNVDQIINNLTYQISETNSDAYSEQTQKTQDNFYKEGNNNLTQKENNSKQKIADKLEKKGGKKNTNQINTKGGKGILTNKQNTQSNSKNSKVIENSKITINNITNNNMKPLNGDLKILHQTNQLERKINNRTESIDSGIVNLNSRRGGLEEIIEEGMKQIETPTKAMFSSRIEDKSKNTDRYNNSNTINNTSSNRGSSSNVVQSKISTNILSNLNQRSGSKTNSNTNLIHDPNNQGNTQSGSNYTIHTNPSDTNISAGKRKNTRLKTKVESLDLRSHNSQLSMQNTKGFMRGKTSTKLIMNFNGDEEDDEGSTYQNYNNVQPFDEDKNEKDKIQNNIEENSTNNINSNKGSNDYSHLGLKFPIKPKEDLKSLRILGNAKKASNNNLNSDDQNSSNRSSNNNFPNTSREQSQYYQSLLDIINKQEKAADKRTTEKKPSMKITRKFNFERKATMKIDTKAALTEETQKYMDKMKKVSKGLENLDSLMNDKDDILKKLMENKDNGFKDFHINQDIKFHLMEENSEEGKKRYQEFMDQMENLKNFDVNSYVHTLEKNYDEIKEELENLTNLRKREERLNQFHKCFYNNREKSQKLREFWDTKLIVKDNKFKAKMGPLMHTTE